MATQHPLMIIQQDKDSIYMTADTLYSGRLTDMAGFEKTFLTPEGITNDSLQRDSLQRDSLYKPVVLNAKDTSNRNRYIQAFHRVRIFTDSLQAVCDSMFYSGVDSVFRLFQNPVTWANGTQVTGDTMYLFTMNKKPQRIRVFENGMVINKTAESYFNQLKGNTINGYFIDGNIDYMRAKGSAESIYYIQDEDSAYSGVNRSTADIIDIYFRNKELSRVVFRSDVNGTLYPFRQVNHQEMRVRAFQWLEIRRPKTKFELFEEPSQTE
jgi:hypothetical protein